MPTAEVNGVPLHFVRSGASGPPLVLVHGSWGSHEVWSLVAPALADRFRVVAYDRRGHGASGQPPGQGSVRDDAADLAGLIEALGLGPAWVAGNSFGASIALRLAGERPDLFLGVMAHEPPLFGLLADDPALAPVLAETGSRVAAVVERIAAGDDAGAAELFVETVALGPGAWAAMPADARVSMIEHAATFLDEAGDPEQLQLDLAGVTGFTKPTLLSMGDRSPPAFATVIARLASALPAASVRTMPGAGHIPHATDPAAYVAMLSGFVAGGASGGAGRDDPRSPFS